MSEPLKSIEEIKRIAEMEAQAKNNEEAVADETNAVVATPTEQKSISTVSVDDIKVKIDNNQSVAKQAEDVVDLMATAKAVQDEDTADALTKSKADELLAKAKKKRLSAETAVLEAETDKQKARRALYEAVLEDFGIKTHLPSWLMVILVILFTPLYIAKSLLIGVPLGFVKTVIDNLDNVVCRYERVGDTVKPKVKVIVWIIFALLVATAVALIVLKCLKII